jgi:hypothetical protein
VRGATVRGWEGARCEGAKVAEGDMCRLPGVGLRSECMWKHLDMRPFAAKVNRHDVEPAWLVDDPPARQEIFGHPGHALLLHPGDGSPGAAERGPGARLHFYEHERAAEPRNDVNLAMSGAVAPFNNCVPPAD